ncbi:HNH endonuclease [Pengzhenrongella sp.]|jgi:putative component of membrane protein insertase Oxa1/YidC/SpoIIIJ protein YidD|uniref:HNH endonuclease n=1 Tax=Pengzhenrongella sp. TaxID=2888820 RepID=UPI0039C9B677
MVVTPLLAPQAAPAPNPLEQVANSMIQGMWLGVTSTPLSMLVASLLALVVVVRIYRVLRWAPLMAAGRDPIRRYTGADRAAVLFRAGMRCERDGLLSGRCNQTEQLHADHIHPHSKGGTTTVANGQALCSRHNKQKAARIPFNWELRRLERRRAAYSPAGMSVAVIRRSRREPTPGSTARRR